MKTILWILFAAAAAYIAYDWYKNYQAASVANSASLANSVGSATLAGISQALQNYRGSSLGAGSSPSISPASPALGTGLPWGSSFGLFERSTLPTSKIALSRVTPTAYQPTQNTKQNLAQRIMNRRTA